MILAVDIGNSNIVIGCFDKNEIMFIERLSTNHSSTQMEYTVMIRNILDLNGLDGEKIDGGIISSVVPQITETVRLAMERLGCGRVMVVGPGIKTGLKILLDNPAQLGSDRVADAVAAVNLYKAPLILIDMGTATTISVIDADESFLGGMIIPGLAVSLDSLTSRTSQLPNISLTPPKRVIGTNTVDCMKSGILYATAASLDGVIERIEEELGESCTVISTGGLADKVIGYCKREILLDETLLLKGLKIIYEKNKNGGI
ncbi:MAG: type III pantothenate kinase [Ruminococcus sp.]|nr:type III pantothenate kinase [Ruminococcus sp.]